MLNWAGGRLGSMGDCRQHDAEQARRTALILIGTHKTGTSTVQRFLWVNRHRLKKRGIFITTSNWGMGNYSGLRAATCVSEMRRVLPYCVAGSVVRRGIFLKKITQEYQEYQKTNLPYGRKNVRRTLSASAAGVSRQLLDLFSNL